MAVTGTCLLAHLRPGPVQHLVNLRPPISPPTIRRRSSIRPVARTSDVDFDQIPSPRPLNAFHRALPNGGPGPSTLSHSRMRQESDSPNEDAGEYDYGAGEDEDRSMLDDHTHQYRSPPDRRTSFSQIDQDEEEEEEEEEEPTPKPTRLQKQKGKAVARPDQEEEQIAQGLEDVELEPESDSLQQRPPVKKPKGSAETGNRPSRSSKKENRGMQTFPGLFIFTEIMISPQRRNTAEPTKDYETPCILARRTICVW